MRRKIGLQLLILLTLGQSSRAERLEMQYDFFERGNSETELATNALVETQQTLQSSLQDNLNKDDFLNRDQVEPELQFLQNQWYENEKFKFYNHTRYDLADAKTKYLQRGAQALSLSDLNVSLGYGLAYKLSKFQTIGYEYLSTFPYDHGQSIRFFWKKTF